MYSQSSEKSISKEKLVGMQVIDGNGYSLGVVKDIGFTLGKMEISLIVEDKTGASKEIPWNAIQAAGDYVLIKPQQEVKPQQEARPVEATPIQTETKASVQQPTEHICPTCKGQLTYIPQYQRWYCYKCQKYA